MFDMLSSTQNRGLGCSKISLTNFGDPVNPVDSEEKFLPFVFVDCFHETSSISSSFRYIYQLRFTVDCCPLLVTLKHTNILLIKVWILGNLLHVWDLVWNKGIGGRW